MCFEDCSNVSQNSCTSDNTTIHLTPLNLLKLPDMASFLMFWINFKRNLPHILHNKENYNGTEHRFTLCHEFLLHTATPELIQIVSTNFNKLSHEWKSRASSNTFESSPYQYIKFWLIFYWVFFMSSYVKHSSRKTCSQ